jgi:hypothetical protein
MFAKQRATAAVLLLVCAANAEAQECFAMETDLKVCILDFAGCISLLLSGWCSSAIFENRMGLFLQQSPILPFVVRFLS